MKKSIQAVLLLLTIGGCSSEGIDRNRTSITSDGLFQNDGDIGGTPDPANPDASLGLAINNPGPSRYIQLEKLNFEASLPSIISLLFRATDQYGNAVPGLQTSDFFVEEDNLPVSGPETSLSVVPHTELPFALRTVLMVDISSSILPEDLEQVKQSIQDLLIDSSGRSMLMEQQEIAIYTFDDTITRIKGFSSSAQNLVNAIDQIAPAVAITPTDLYGAITEGTALWEDSFDLNAITQGVLIIITDGSDTAGKHTFADALAATLGKSVYTVGVGAGASSEVLTALGRSGSFTLHHFNQLSATLAAINRQVSDTANSFYYLHYASPKRRAEGDPGQSDHQLTVSVHDNANHSGSALLSDVFNSAEFSNVQAQVIVAGPTNVDAGQTATYRATTRWGPTVTPDYQWLLSSNIGGACSIVEFGGNTIKISGIQPGNCTISAQDSAAGDARAWLSVVIAPPQN